MKLNLKINSMLLCLALFAACSSDDDGQVAQDSSQEQKQPQKTYPLSIEVAENPMVQEGEGGSSRRAPITTGSSLNSFNLSYMYGEYYSSSPITTNKNGEGKWVNSAGADKGWPLTEETVTWYAYTDGSFNYNSGSPYISLTVDENTFYQKDLMVSTASGTYAGTDGKLSLTFDHVCSALQFQVKKAKNLNDYRLDISEIQLCNIIKQGEYNFGAETWNLGATRSVYTLTSGAIDDLSNTDYQPLDGGVSSTGPWLFLIPQTLTAWHPTTNATGAYIKITCTLTLKSPSTVVHNGVAYIPFAKVLEKSTKYNISINIGKNSLYKSDGTKVITES